MRKTFGSRTKRFWEGGGVTNLITKIFEQIPNEYGFLQSLFVKLSKSIQKNLEVDSFHKNNVKHKI